MAVKIRDIKAVEGIGVKIKDYAENLKDGISKVNVKMVEKAEGSEGRAIEAYTKMVEKLRGEIFEGAPRTIQTFGIIIERYINRLDANGFASKVMSEEGVIETFCEQYAGSQVSKTEEEAMEIENIIKAAAELLSEGRADTDRAGTDIETPLTDFKEEIGEIVKNIGKTKEDVTEAQKRFKEKLEDILEEINGYMSKMQNVVAISQSMPPSLVKNLINDGKLTESNMIYMELISKKSDGKALSAVLRGEYVEFFEIEPSEISDGIYAVMLEGLAMDISIPEEGSNGKNEMRKVEDAMNAVLAQTPKLRKQHLERMSAMAEVSAIQNSALAYLADSKGAVVERDIAHENYQRYQVISQLTELFYLLGVETSSVFREDERISIETTTLLEIHTTLSNLTIDKKGNVEFKIESDASGVLAEKYAENTDMNALKASISNGGIGSKMRAEYERTLLELRENKNRMMEEYINSLLEIGVKTGASIINPIAGAIVTAVVEGLAGNAGEAGKEIIGGANDAKVIPDEVAVILKGGVDAISATVDLMKKPELMTQKEIETWENMWVDILGIDYTIMSVKNDSSDGNTKPTYSGAQIGIPSYKNRKTVEYLAENGIGNFFEENEDTTWEKFEDWCEREKKVDTPEYRFLSEGLRKDEKIENLDISILTEMINDGLGVAEGIVSFRQWAKSKGE